MAIWNAAEPSSKLWYLAEATIARVASACRRAPQLLAALALAVRLGLALVARGPVPPGVHALLESVLDDGVLGELDIDLHLLGRRLHGGLADGLGLIERPQVGSFDVGAERLRLRALAERLGDGEKQRQHGDENGDLLVLALHHPVARDHATCIPLPEANRRLRRSRIRRRISRVCRAVFCVSAVAQVSAIRRARPSLARGGR